MNWNQLKNQIEDMTEEQRNMPVILVNEYDDIQEIDEAIWWNVYGTPNLEPNQPYLIPNCNVTLKSYY
jgi:hypothetical protein